MPRFRPGPVVLGLLDPSCLANLTRRARHGGPVVLGMVDAVFADVSYKTAVVLGIVLPGGPIVLCIVLPRGPHRALHRAAPAQGSLARGADKIPRRASGRAKFLVALFNARQKYLPRFLRQQVFP